MNRAIGPDGTYVSAAPAVPGRTLGITAFVLSFFLQVIALVIGVIALLQSRKAGVPNNFAVAAIVISAVLVTTALIGWIAWLVSGGIR